MTKLSPIAPALGFAGVLMVATISPVDAQGIGPAAIWGANAHQAAQIIDATFFFQHGGGGHGGWGHEGRYWRRGWGNGPYLGFDDDVVIAPDLHAYGSGCGFYRMRWHETGQQIWRDRFLSCMYG